MKILCIVRQVPDSRAAIKIASDGLKIEKASVKFVCNPFDEFAVEQAITLKETRSDIEEIVVASIGADDSNQAIRTALAMGADRGLLVCDERLDTHDEIFQAQALALAINKQAEPFDLILCGKQAIDTDSGEFGPALAEFLDLPHVGAAVRLEIPAEGTSLRAYRRIEGAEEIVESSLPALITCEKGLNEPRFTSLPNLLKAKKKPVEIVSGADLTGFETASARLAVVELSPPAARPACTFLEGEPPEMARELVRLLHEEAKVI